MNFFAKKKTTSSPAIDAVFVFLRDQINREDLVEQQFASWEQIRHSNPFDYARCVALYLSIERFIVNNKPLVVKTEWTKETLRTTVGKSVDIQALPEFLRIFFVPDAIRRKLFFRIATGVLVEILEATVGVDRVNVLTESVAHVNGEDRNEWYRVGRNTFAALYREVISFLGEKTARARISETYQFIEAAYGVEYLGDFFEICPEELFANERISYTSHERLASQVAHVTQIEHKKVQEIQDAMAKISAQNTLLENTKKAMINILDDARALEEQLKIEKAGVEQKVLERTDELHQEQARLTASINSLDMGYILVDKNRRIISTNRAVKNLLGVDAALQVLDDVELHMLHAVNLMGYFTKVAHDGHAQRVNDVVINTKHFDIFIGPIFSRSDTREFLGCVITITDISDAKALERSRDEFFSIASHELRTPLTAIRGNTALIKEYFGAALKDPQLVEMVDDIHESSVRLIDLVNDFLDVSRLEQKRMVFHMESIDVSAVIDSTLKEYQVTGSRRNLSLIFERPSSPIPFVFVDKDKVKQVLINLIGNALKFTESGGVTIGVHRKVDMVEIEVVDTGRGIPYENQSLLFRKFTQAGDSLFTRDTTRGTGLGLYISKLIVEGMGGTICLASSVPGKGSVFAFTLPITHENHVSPNIPGQHLGEKAVGLLPPSDGV